VCAALATCEAFASDPPVEPRIGRPPARDDRHMWRFLLLRFLPRRLIPLLALYEIVQLVRRFRRDGDVAWRTDQRWSDDDRIVDGHATVVPPRAVDRGPTTSP